MVHVIPVESTKSDPIKTLEGIDTTPRTGHITSISLLEYLKDGLGIAGVKYACDKKSHPFRRYFWVLLLLLAFGWMTSNIVRRFIYFTDKPKAVNMEVVYRHNIRFPAVTICNQNIFRMTQAYAWQQSSNEFFPFPSAHMKRNLLQFLSDIFRLNDIKDENTRQIEMLHFKKMYQVYLEERPDYEIFYKDIAHDIYDMLIMCYWKGKLCGPENFTAVFTDVGICYRFNFNESNPLFTESPGVSGGLSLFLNIEQYEYMRSSTRTAGFKVLIHPQDVESMDMYNSGELVSPGETIMAIRETNYDMLVTGSACNEVEHMSSCLLACVSKYISERCGCREAYMIEKYTSVICDPIQIAACSYIEKAKFASISNYSDYCECSPHCKRSTYEVKTSHSVFSKFLLNFNVLNPPNLRNLEEISRIRDWMMLDLAVDNHTYTDAIVELAENFYLAYYISQWNIPYAYNMLGNIVDKFSSELSSEPVKCMEASLERIMSGLKNITDIIIKGYFFNFSDPNRIAEDFVIRIAHDIISKDEYMRTFLNDLVNTCENISSDIDNVRNCTQNSNTSNTTLLIHDIMQLMTNIDDYLNIIMDSTSDMNIRYERLDALVNSQETIKLMTWEGYEKDEEFFRSNFVQLKVYFEDMTVVNIKQYEADNFNSLICDIGGSIGLYLGASILTIFELLDLLLKYCSHKTKET